MPFKPGVSGNPKGRPKGSVAIYSKKSVQKLEDLGHDPIEELHKMYIQAAKRKNLDLMFKINEKLMAYGYSKQPTLIEGSIEQSIIPMLAITGKDKEEESDESTTE